MNRTPAESPDRRRDRSVGTIGCTGCDRHYGPGGGPTLTLLQLLDLHGGVAGTAGAGLAATYSYDEFGNPTNAHTVTYGWLGGEARAQAGLGNLTLIGVRVYDPATGRFLQTDPIPGGSANAYDYADQDPVNGLDLGGTAVAAIGGGENSGCDSDGPFDCDEWANPHNVNAAGGPKHAVGVGDLAGALATAIWDNRGKLASGVSIGLCLAPTGWLVCGFGSGVALIVRAQQRGHALRRKWYRFGRHRRICRFLGRIWFDGRGGACEC